MIFRTYDAQGNPTSYLGHTLTWEKGRQLKSFDNTQYTYNANGIRTSKTVNGVEHTFVLDGTKILKESWGSNTIIPMYDNEDNVCGIIYNDVPYYFFKNLQGDVIAIVDKDAQTVAKYSYDAWGVCTISQDSSDCGIATVNPFRYRGYYYDAEIGMYYLQTRYYDPSVGRFVNGDNPVLESAAGIIRECNIYMYCNNCPIMGSDSYGLLYISYETLRKTFQSISSMSRAYRIHTNKGLWGTLAKYAAPYISRVFAWVCTIPAIGQLLFWLIIMAALWFAGEAIYAYYIKKTGLDISVGWRWFVPYLKVTYR